MEKIFNSSYIISRLFKNLELTQGFLFLIKIYIIFYKQPIKIKQPFTSSLVMKTSRHERVGMVREEVGK